MMHEHDAEYNSRYDVSYCPECDIWLEEQCLCGEECIFSVVNAGPLPNKPSEAE